MSSSDPSLAPFAPYEIFQLLYRLMPSFIASEAEPDTARGKAAYLDAIRQLAPDRDVHELDAELAQVNDAFQAAFSQQLGNVGNQIRVIKHAFLNAINSFQAEYPNGYTDGDGNQLPKPDHITTYRSIVNMTTGMFSCADESVASPRDQLRERFTHLIMQRMDLMEVATEIEESIAVMT